MASARPDRQKERCRRPAPRRKRRSLPCLKRQHFQKRPRELRPSGNRSNHHRYGEVKTRLTIGASADFDRFCGWRRTEYDSAFSRRDTPEGMLEMCAPENRGRREDRVRAAPAVSCAKCTKKCAHEHTGSAEASGLPCAMVLRLISCSPRRTAFLPPSSLRSLLLKNLTP